MTWTLGASTKTTILKGESHKLYQEFEVSGTVHKGQPVVLEAGTGKVVAAGAAALEKDIIGISIHEGNSAYGDTVVVMMKAYAIVYCKASADLSAGAVEIAGYDTTDAYPGNQKEFAGYVTVAANATAGAQVGWALEPATAGDILRVAVKS